jgi:hypothetical protein
MECFANPSSQWLQDRKSAVLARISHEELDHLFRGMANVSMP